MADETCAFLYLYLAHRLPLNPLDSIHLDKRAILVPGLFKSCYLSRLSASRLIGPGVGIDLLVISADLYTVFAALRAL